MPCVQQGMPRAPEGTHRITIYSKTTSSAVQGICVLLAWEQGEWVGCVMNDMLNREGRGGEGWGPSRASRRGKSEGGLAV